MADLGNKIKQKQNFSVKIKKINNKQKVKKIGLNFWCCENYLKYNLFKLLIKKQCKQLVNIIIKNLPLKQPSLIFTQTTILAAAATTTTTTAKTIAAK